MKNGSVSLLLKNLIPVSMKNNIYNIFVLFTAMDLISYECDCQYGEIRSEAVICVHILPLLFQLTILLVEGMAQNMMLELCARIDATEECSISLLFINHLKQIISTLMFTAGIDNIINSIDKIYDILDYFAIGIQKGNKVNKGTYDPNLLGPIINLPNEYMISSEKMIIDRLQNINKPSSNDIVLNSNDVLCSINETVALLQTKVEQLLIQK